MVLSGALSGLAGITPGSGYVAPPAALAIGFLTSMASFWANHFLKSKLHIDDVLDVTSLQAVPGMTGTILVGLFADEKLFDIETSGVFFGGHGPGWRLVGVQTLAVVVVALWTAVFTFAILKGIDWTIGVNITAEEEEVRG